MNHRRPQNVTASKPPRRAAPVIQFDEVAAAQRSDEIIAAAQAAAERAQRLRAQAASLAEVHRELREANQRYADLYDFVPVPYLIISAMGIIVQVNDAAVQMLGGDRPWIVGRPLIAYVATEDMRTALNALQTARRHASESIEIRLRAADGIRPVQVVSRRYGDAAGTASFHVAIIDLSEVRRLDAERRAAEEDRHRSQEAERVAQAASEAKDEFLAMLSHELRTPLTPILAAVDSLCAHDRISGEPATKIEIIRRNVKAEARLIDDLLDLARITRNTLEVQRTPTDLHAVVSEVLEAWRAPLAERGIALESDLAANAHWVNGDPGRLAQVVRNVVNNAAKFTEARGHIGVRTEDHDGRVRLTVVDTGVGMTDAQMGNLFKPFVQSEQWSSRRGLGLGLIISHAIVEGHEGTLEIWSAGPGEGTTVRVEFPTIAASAAQPESAPADAARTDATAKVLLVEDDPDTADMLSVLLACEGFEVKVAGSVRAARGLADGCEVLVSDIALPDGSGLELMREIHANRAMRGIALSGYGSAKDIEKSLDAGFDEHLTKPVDLDHLVAAVRRLTVPREK